MFDHVVFGTSDYEASKAFFLEALKPIGLAVVSEGPLGVKLSSDGKSSLCIRRVEEIPSHLHLAFVAENREQVDAFHRAALAAGAMEIERLSGVEWQRLKRIRLAALQDAPEAFGTTLAAA